VRFLYAENPPSATATEAAKASVAQLEKLPPDLLEALREAAVLLDGERCQEVIGSIARINDKLGARLYDAVKNLRHRELVAQLDSIITRIVT
jgi:hypothetical protein